VEECRELILLLSTREDTFLGPYALLDCRGKEEEVAIEDKKEGVVGEGEKEGAEKEEDEGAAGDGGGDGEKEGVPHGEKLAKLEPLPPLLSDFDLDTHVGLIQKILEVDSNLVEMHSQLSGAGGREVNFWRNYFFHCAFIRYTVGLSIDEIWASKPVPPCPGELAETEQREEELRNSSHHDESATGAEVASHSSQGEIVFEDNEKDVKLDLGEEDVDVVSPQKATEKPAAATGGDVATVDRGASNSPSSASTQDNSYEMIANEAAAAAVEDDDDVVAIVGDVSAAGSGVDIGDDDDGDLDLDDLDAEIARELED